MLSRNHYDYRCFEGLRSIFGFSKCVFQQNGAFRVKINREIVDFTIFRLDDYRGFEVSDRQFKGKKSQNLYFCKPDF